MRRILLSRPDRIGDVVITTACLASVRRHFPDTEIQFLARTPILPLLEGHPHIDTLIPAEQLDRRCRFRSIRHWVDTLRRLAPDAVVHLHPDFRLHLASRLAGIPLRVGYTREAGRWCLTRRIPYRRHLGLRHEAAHNRELVGALGIPPTPEDLPLLPDPGTAGLPPLPNRFVVFHPAAHGSKPRWPEGHWISLAQLLRRQIADIPIVLVGESPAETLARAISPAIDLCGRSSLRELAGLLARATAVISRDSGPAHIAAALGAPTITLMGQCDPVHSPTRWQPLGPRVTTLIRDLAPLPREPREKRWGRCFAAIAPEEVAAATIHWWNQAR